MFIKVTTLDGSEIRINSEKIVEYFNNGHSVHIDLGEREDNYYLVTENIEFIDRVLGVKTYQKHGIPSINEETTLKSVRNVKVLGREVFKYINGFFTMFNEEINEPKMKDVIELIQSGRIRSVRNMGKKTNEALIDFMSDNFPSYKF